MAKFVKLNAKTKLNNATENELLSELEEVLDTPTTTSNDEIPGANGRIFWLNFGVIVKDKSGKEYFISTKYGKKVGAADVTPRAEPANASSEQLKFIRSSNLLTAKLEDTMLAMKPGEKKMLNFQVQLQCVGTEEADVNDSEILDILDALKITD